MISARCAGLRLFTRAGDGSPRRRVHIRRPELARLRKEAPTKRRILLFSALLIGLGVGSVRLQIPRQRSLEEIDDPAVAESYDRISRLPQFRFLRRLFVSELQAYRPHGTLIDIGCGPGYLLRRLARAFPELKLMGIDLSPEMIAAAERNLATIRPEGRIEFRTGDIQALPLSDSSIDFAVSSLSLHHWSDPLQALGEVYRVLKPGGQMLLLDLRRDVRRWFYGLFRFATAFIVPAPLRKAHEPLGSLLSSYTPAELRALLAQAPFSEWSVRGGPLWVWVWVRR